MSKKDKTHAIVIRITNLYKFHNNKFRVTIKLATNFKTIWDGELLMVNKREMLYPQYFHNKFSGILLQVVIGG